MSPSPAATEPVPAWLQPWPRRTQCALAATLLLLLIVLGHASYQSSAGRPLELQKAGTWTRLDLNRADLEQLRAVPGFDEVLARRILDHRQARGEFRSVEELDQVKGIGPAKLNRARPYLKVAAPSNTAPAELRSVSTATPAEPSLGRKQPPAVPLDLNTASAAQLTQVPGLGAVLAQRIIQERMQRPFTSVDELLRIRGIGPATLEKVRPHVTVAPQRNA